MFDLNSLPISGGVVVAGVVVAVVFGAGLGPLVADRTIAASGWPMVCESRLRTDQESQSRVSPSEPDLSCGDITDAIGNGSDVVRSQSPTSTFNAAGDVSLPAKGGRS